MRVWIVKTGEPVPTDSQHLRLWRSGGLAGHLAAAGHDVVWWAGTFHHHTKTHRAATDQSIDLSSNYRLWLVHSPGYTRNRSIARLRDHQILARQFTKLAEQEPVPDVIHCSYPTIDLSHAAVEYGRRHHVPVVLDVRDMWPDIIADALPAFLRWAVAVVFQGSYARARQAFREAAAISGHAPAFVEFGLGLGGRTHGSLDRSFPFTYPSPQPSDAELTTAERYWSERGVTKGDGWFNICCTGNLPFTQAVDTDTPISAARALNARGDRIRLIFCGRGRLLDELRKRFANDPALLTPGWVNGPELWKLMEFSQLGLIPYRPSRDLSPSLPNKAVEYLAGGLPTLTSLDAGYLHDMFLREHCGLFYRAGDVRGLERLLHDARRNEHALISMKANARRLFGRDFTPHRVHRAMEEHLLSVVSAYRANRSARTSS